MNVLLVEDEPRVADFIDRGLRAENHGVTVAASGSEGVDLAKTGEFDVIVLDLMLPDMHGHDVCQRLRLEGDHTPILMLTAMDALEDKIKGLKLGDRFDVHIPALGDRIITVEVKLIATKGEYASWRATRATGEFDLRTFAIRAYPVEKVPELRPGMSAYVDWQQRR